MSKYVGPQKDYPLNKTKQNDSVFLPCLANKSTESRHFQFQNKKHSAKSVDHYFSFRVILHTHSCHLNLS